MSSLVIVVNLLLVDRRRVVPAHVEILQMRVAVLNDIHGNLPALEAVLAEVRAAAVDRIVVGGDVLPGPMPCETMDVLLGLDQPVEFLYGNGEVRWNADQLTPPHKDLIASWPMTLRLTIPPLGDVLFCHATPRDWNECFVKTTAEEELLPIINAANAAIVVCGHTHMHFDRVVGKTRVINAGSVGMPFGRTGADWLLLGEDVQLRHTSFDLDAAVTRFRRMGCPMTEEFIVPRILTPASEQWLDIFAGADRGR